MKHKLFSDEKIIGVLKEQEAGAKVDEICRRQPLRLSAVARHAAARGAGREPKANVPALHRAGSAGPHEEAPQAAASGSGRRSGA